MSCLVHAIPHKGPNFGEGNGDGAPDDLVHGSDFSREVGELEAIFTQKLYKLWKQVERTLRERMRRLGLSRSKGTLGGFVEKNVMLYTGGLTIWLDSIGIHGADMMCRCVPIAARL